jgi:hypothetical protein
MFENPEIVEDFLSFWRHTGSQVMNAIDMKIMGSPL